MSATWLTSDLHLGHKLVSDIRGFRDPQEHDDTIAVRWKRMIQPDDDVWVLGDISAGGAASQLSALAKLMVLPGRKHLVAGNHDSVHPMHGRKPTKWMSFYLDVFEYVCSQATMNIEGEKLLLSHFPYTGDHTVEERHSQWRFKDTGRWLVHGHTHSQEIRTGPKQIQVGLDAWKMKPVNLGEIGKIIKLQESQ